MCIIDNIVKQIITSIYILPNSGLLKQCCILLHGSPIEFKQSFKNSLTHHIYTVLADNQDRRE